jgi:hypothetical protein
MILQTSNNYHIKSNAARFSSQNQKNNKQMKIQNNKKYLLSVTEKIKEFSTIYLKIAKPQFESLITIEWLMQQSNKVFRSS